MLHPASMHEYCELAEKYGFTPYDYDPDFDQKVFLKQWNEIRKSVKKEASYQRVKIKYPELLLNSKGTSRICIYSDGDAVYPLVDSLAHGISNMGIPMEMPVYAPAWRVQQDMYVAPEEGMRRMEEKDAVKYIEWSQKRFGLFDILSRKKQHLDVMILNDADVTGQAASFSIRDLKTQKLRLGIALPFNHPTEIEKKDWLQYEYVFFHELSHILYALRFDAETQDKIVPKTAGLFCRDTIPGYKKLTQAEKHEVAVDFLTEGMLTGTEYEKLFCPHKDYKQFTETAKEFFEKTVSEI